MGIVFSLLETEVTAFGSEITICKHPPHLWRVFVNFC